MLPRHIFLTRRAAVLALLAIALLWPGTRIAPGGEAAAQTATATKFDYVMILASNDLASAVDSLRIWKERIGFSVVTVTTADIYSLYPSGDDAEKIWMYLHDRYHPDDWGIRYVLLVGDIDEIPIRLLYENDDEPAYPTDYYYANLDPPLWDSDGDDRWGEFSDDSLDPQAEVIVGRIPTNVSTEVRRICRQIIEFEQDTGAWKRQAILSHGILDYAPKADTADLSEYMITDLFDPMGWSTHRLYEVGGLNPTSYLPDGALSPANHNAGCGLRGLVSLNGHGNPGGQAGFVWTNDFNGDGEWDSKARPPEHINNEFCNILNIAGGGASNGITMLDGCSTAGLVGPDTLFPKSPLRSRYLIRAPQNTIAEEYLREGAPGVIGTTAGGEYSGAWSSPADDGANTIHYFIFRNLIDRDQPAGDAFFDAAQEYAETFGMERGQRVFNYFGDPSVSLKGIQDRPGGPDELVHEGTYHGYATDNDDNGDMYLSVLTTDQSTSPGEITVYKSTDHGVNWSIWTVVTGAEAIWSHDIMVSRFQDVSTPDERLHVVYTTPSGNVYDVRLQLADPSSYATTLLPSDPQWAVRVSLARDPNPMPAFNYIYAIWEYEDGGGHNVRLCASIDNGASWYEEYNAPDRIMPDVDAGVGGRIYATWVVDPWVADSDVEFVKSDDHGFSWSFEVVLTAGDDASMHTYPSVGASTDGPTGVWVAYDYQTQSDQWGIGRDLRFAYSADGGVNWVKNRVLAADVGVDDWLADIKGYRAASNAYVNIAYNRDRQPNPGYRRDVVWRYSNAGLPRAWSYQRSVNDYQSSAPGAFAPRIVYSPGAGPGSGVVYGGPANTDIYFSSPWLPGVPPVSPEVPTVAAGDVHPPIRGVAAASRPAAQLVPEETTSTGPLVWAEMTNLPRAFTINDIVPFVAGDLLAAGSATVPGRNQGAVYLFTEGAWTRLSDPDDAWWLSSVVRTGAGTILTGGIIVYDESNWAGVVYRSIDEGASWTPTLLSPSHCISAMQIAQDGSIIACSGWTGLIHRSTNDGQSWTPVGELGAGIYIHDIMQVESGDFLVALENAPSPVMVSSNLETWVPVVGLETVADAYSLADAGSDYYVGVRDAAGPAVYRAPAGQSGLSWVATLPIPIPGPEAVTSVAVGPYGRVFAGLDQPFGPQHTYVLSMPAGGGSWTIYGGGIDLATSVHRLLSWGPRLYAATGNERGNVYEVSFEIATGVGEGPSLPGNLYVRPNYPNPFNPHTTIQYYMPESGRVSVTVFDVAGRVVRSIKESVYEGEGWHRATWDGRDDRGRAVTSGVYFYRLTAGSRVETGKLSLVR